MNSHSQVSSSSVQTATMFLKPSFVITAQSSGLFVSVTVQVPVEQPAVPN
jgi:hypothetical protein